MKQVLLALGLAVFSVVTFSLPSAALGLKIAPLSYEAELQKGEIKKGYVDISNPSSSSIKVKLEAQGFRQIDDEGSLEFFASEQIKAGVKLDFETITIGPREAYRVYFLLDSAKLAAGDNFGAIFASTIPVPGNGSTQSVRVGTILTVQNGASDARLGEVTSFVANWLQVGEELSATTTVKNTADPQKATGFYPSIQASTAPYGSRTIKGPLVFAGRTRTVEIQHPGAYFGPVLLGAHVGDSSRTSLVFAVTGYWRWLAPTIALVVIIFTLVYLRVYPRHHQA
ncbi:MAG: hypothetical protein ABIQ64_03860 [Candidatus Saccharimonadales bacterium]